jgi:hypothetical protein
VDALVGRTCIDWLIIMFFRDILQICGGYIAPTCVPWLRTREKERTCFCKCIIIQNATSQPKLSINLEILLK